MLVIRMASRPQHCPMTPNWPECYPQMFALPVPASAPAWRVGRSPCYEAQHVVRATCFGRVSQESVNGADMLTTLE